MFITGKIQLLQLENLTSIAFADSGDKTKPCLLFLHGLANYHAVWQPAIDILQQSFRCIAIDLPGHGNSALDNKSYGIDYYAKCIQECIGKLGLRQFSFVGHSMGGHIALYLALQKVKGLHKLLLLASSGIERFTPAEANFIKAGLPYANMFAGDEMQLMNSIQGSLFKPHPYAQKLFDSLWYMVQQQDRLLYRKMIQDSIYSMLDTPVFEQLQSLEYSTLLVFGEKDPIIPNPFVHSLSTRRIAELAAKEIPMMQLVMLKECGHFVQIEKTLEVVKAIHDFMTK
jgi:pimeloyl-ACP methyl ester carboxylesterase